MLSHGFWTRKFGRDPNAIGQSIVIADVVRRIVGICWCCLHSPIAPGVELWTPEQIAPEMGFGLWNYAGVARLRDRVGTNPRAQSSRRSLGGLALAFPGDQTAIGNSDIGLSFTGRLLKETYVGNVRQALWILLASVVTVLLIACANIANLFLVRSEVRQREVAVRQRLAQGAWSSDSIFSAKVSFCWPLAAAWAWGSPLLRRERSWSPARRRFHGCEKSKSMGPSSRISRCSAQWRRWRLAALPSRARRFRLRH